MALVDDVRVSLRVTQTMTDAEVEALIDAALADMRRCGVDESQLAESAPAPLVKMAVILYAKAYYGYDNKEGERFEASYRAVLASLLNSRANVLLKEGGQ